MPAIFLVRDGFDVPRLSARPPELIGEWLVIGQVDHRHAVGLDPVGERDGGMMEVLGRDTHAADVVHAFSEFVIGDRCGQLAEFDRKIGELHLAREHLAQ